MITICRIAVIPAVFLVLASACNENGNGNGGEQATSSSTGDTTLEEQLGSILLRDNEVPDGLEAGTLDYSTNQQLAGPSQEELERLNMLGRQLGVDLAFVPVSEIPLNTEARGGMQNSASVYVDPAGAAEAFRVRSEAARTNDWPSNYTDLEGVSAAEVASVVGDETYWVRVTGIDKCDAASATPGASPAETCPPPRLGIVDHVLLRSGRTFVYLMVVSDASPDDPDDIYAAQVRSWAQTVADRALQTFPTAQQ